MQSKRPRLIVGVDPGTTLGMAVLDLDGHLLLLTSGRNLSKNDVLNILLGIGVPVLVASDRVIAPHLVSELASSLGSRIFLPSQEVAAQEKKRVVEGASSKFETYAVDEHQTAALYAALKAHAHFKNLFEEVEVAVQDELRKRSPQIVDDVKALVIKDVPPSRGVKAVLQGKGTGVSDQKALKALRKEVESSNERISSLRAKLSEARAEIMRLRAMQPKSHEKPPPTSVELQETQEKLRDALHEIEGLRRRIEPFRLSGGDWIRLCPLGPLTISTVKSAVADSYLVSGRIAYATRVAGDAERCARALASAGIHTLVLETEDAAFRRDFMRNGVVVLRADGLQIEWRYGASWIKGSELERALKGTQKDLDLVNRERIRDMIESYREERLRG